MKIALLIVLLIANIPIYKFLKNHFFEDDNDFNESLNYLFIPNIISLFRGEYGKDLYAEFRFAFLFLLSIAAVSIEYFIIAGILSIFI
jgi:hypothetical protein